MENEETAAMNLASHITHHEHRAYTMLRTLIKDRNMIRESGYRDLGHACEGIIGRASRDIEKLVTAHEARFRS